MSARARAILFALFTVSGFTGLIYESIWTQYLKLFLGHAAYAQALVLAIFMGGLALGSWICSRASSGWRNVLLGYAATEAAVGVFAIAFHPVFVRAIEFSYDAILPHLAPGAATSAYRWTFSAALILPQAVLLGMTFPLMVAAFVRSSPATPGRVVALLYFTNSLGAAVGALATGFFLVARLGLPGTMALAGALNLVLATVAWRLSRGGAAPAPVAPAPASAASSVWYRRLLLVSAGTGAASFIYEMGWIRMLSLVLGSSTHAFELMLSAFILGLAFGGLWIHRRIDASGDPRRLLAIVQVAMGLLALATLPLYGSSFHAMRWLVASLEKSDAGYLGFNLASNAIALAVMLPATFCAGMTLPLITAILLKEGSGEKSIGSVYAANTIGAIGGVFFAIHLGMPALGLKGLLVAGASVDVTLGVVLAWWARPARRWRTPAALAAVAASGILAATLLVRLDPYLMASGVYRQGELLSPQVTKLLFHEDGKTATITVDEEFGNRDVRTNGKSDSLLAFAPGTPTHVDEFTMILAGALPLALHPHPRIVANIGLGTGLTSHTLLSSPEIERLDTIEIEQKMIDGARLLSERVGRVFTDPRSRIHVDDAKSFFAVQGGRYDVIISEPSNPWVSGVASLFSEEFYRTVTRHLDDDGLLVQWVQLYEIDLSLVASVMKALSPHFSDYEVYAPSNWDMLIVARKRGALPALSNARLGAPALAAELARVDVHGVEDLRVRRVGSKRFLQPFFDSFPIRANSDYFPVLEQRAAKTRFLGVDAMDLVGLSLVPLPLADMLGGTPVPGATGPLTPCAWQARVSRSRIALGLREFLVSGRFDPAYDTMVSNSSTSTAALRDDYSRAKAAAAAFEQIFLSASAQRSPFRRLVLFDAATRIFPFLGPSESASIWRRLESGPGGRTLSTVEHDYVTLFKAVANREAASMKTAATRLLDTEEDITLARRQYVLAAALLANVADGTPERAAALWSRFGRLVFPPGEPGPALRALLSHVPSR